jgi:hypothetical protein
MSGLIDKKLEELGITLPPRRRRSPLCGLRSDACCSFREALPAGRDPGEGQARPGVRRAGSAATRACAVNLLAQLRAALGDLDKVVRVVRLGGFINSQRISMAPR